MRLAVSRRSGTGLVRQQGVIGLIAVGLGILVALAPSAAALPAAAVVLLLLAAVHPIWPLAAALLAGPFAAWEATFLGTPIPSGQLLVALTIGSWLGWRIVRRDRREWPRLQVMGPIGVFIAVGLLSLWSAESAWDGVTEIGKWVEIALLATLVVDMARQERRLTLPVWLSLLLLPAVVQAGLAIYQFALAGSGPEHLLIAPGRYRAYGTFMQPNPFGGYMTFNLMLALGAGVGFGATWFEQDGSRRAILWRGGALLAVAALLAGGLLASWSRGAWLSALVAGGVLVFLVPRRPLVGFGLLMGGAALLGGAMTAGLLPADVEQRLLGFAADLQVGDVRGVDITDANFAVIERLAHWQAALGMARDHLWLGVGLGNYAAVYASYALVNWQNPLGHAHNYYLNLLAEVGVPGLLVYVWLWAAIVRATWRRARDTVGVKRGVAIGLMAAWFGMAFHHLLDNLYVNNFFVHLGVALGVLYTLGPGNGQQSGKRRVSVADTSRFDML